MDEETKAAMESGKPVMIFHINSVGQMNPSAKTVNNHYWGDDFVPVEDADGKISGAVRRNPSKAKADSKPKPARSPRSPKPKSAETKEHGVERDTFSCSKHITPNHLKLLFQELQQAGWVSSRSNEADFRALFSGKASSCEIIWTGEMGVGTLKELFDTMLDEQLISLPGGARSVNSVLENHFVDANGNFVSDLNSSSPAESAFQTIYRLVDILKVRLKTDDVKKEFDELETWDPSYH